MKDLIKAIAMIAMVLLTTVAQAKYNGIPTIPNGDGTFRAADAREAVLPGYGKGYGQLDQILRIGIMPDFNVDMTSAYINLTNMNDRLLSGDFNLTIRNK